MALAMKAARLAQRGMTLLELMVAVTVLTIGVGGVAVVIPLAVGRNFANRQQGSSTALAQMTVEKIMAVPAGTTSSTITDCAGNANTVNVTAGGAALLSSGAVDFTEAQGTSGAPAGYYMNFTLCSTQGQQATYDVRWNIQTPGQTKLVTVSAKLKSAVNNATILSAPVTIRSMIGQGD